MNARPDLVTSLQFLKFLITEFGLKYTLFKTRCRLDLPFVLLLSLRLHSVELVRIKRVDVFGIVLVGFGAGFFGFAWLDRLGRLAFERRVVENSWGKELELV